MADTVTANRTSPYSCSFTLPFYAKIAPVALRHVLSGIPWDYHRAYETAALCKRHDAAISQSHLPSLFLRSETLSRRGQIPFCTTRVFRAMRILPRRLPVAHHQNNDCNNSIEKIVM